MKGKDETDENDQDRMKKVLTSQLPLPVRRINLHH